MKTGYYSLFEAYKTARNKVNVAVKKAKKNYVTTEVARNGNSHCSWEAINQLIGRKTKVNVVTEVKVGGDSSN